MHTIVRSSSACGERKAALAREFGIGRETLQQYLRQNSGRTARAGLNGKGDKYRSRKMTINSQNDIPKGLQKDPLS